MSSLNHGVYIIQSVAHSAVLTPDEHWVNWGAAVRGAKQLLPPVLQEWDISPELGVDKAGSYLIAPAFKDLAGNYVITKNNSVYINRPTSEVALERYVIESIKEGSDVYTISVSRLGATKKYFTLNKANEQVHLAEKVTEGSLFTFRFVNPIHHK